MRNEAGIAHSCRACTASSGAVTPGFATTLQRASSNQQQHLTKRYTATRDKQQTSKHDMALTYPCASVENRRICPLGDRPKDSPTILLWCATILPMKSHR